MIFNVLGFGSAPSVNISVRAVLSSEEKYYWNSKLFAKQANISCRFSFMKTRSWDHSFAINLHNKCIKTYVHVCVCLCILPIHSWTRYGPLQLMLSTNMSRQNCTILSGDFNAKVYNFQMIKIYLSACSTDLQICKLNFACQSAKMFAHSIWCQWFCVTRIDLHVLLVTLHFSRFTVSMHSWLFDDNVTYFNKMTLKLMSLEIII